MLQLDHGTKASSARCFGFGDCWASRIAPRGMRMRNSVEKTKLLELLFAFSPSSSPASDGQGGWFSPWELPAGGATTLSKKKKKTLGVTRACVTDPSTTALIDLTWGWGSDYLQATGKAVIYLLFYLILFIFPSVTAGLNTQQRNSQGERLAEWFRRRASEIKKLN